MRGCVHGLLALLLAAAGCSSIVGIEDPVVDGPTTDTMTGDGDGDDTGDGDGDGDAPGFSLTVPEDPVRLDRDGSVSINVQVTVDDGFDESVTFVTDLPPGISQTPLEVTIDSSGVQTLEYTANLEAEVGLGAYTLEATANGSGETAMGTVNLFVAGGPGTLDETFGSTGEVPRPQGLVGVEVLPTENILVYGDPNILGQVLPNSDPDMTYGTMGRVEGPMAEIPRFLFRTSDGRAIVMSEDPTNDTILVRAYLASGMPDSSWGTGGITPINGALSLMDADIDPMDNVYLALDSTLNDINYYRINPAGFATFLDMNPSRNTQVLAARPAGGFVIAEQVLMQSVAFTGYTAGGSRDPNFGQNGTAQIDVGVDCIQPFAIAARGDGFVSAWSCMGSTLLVAVTANGTADATFGSNGVVILPIATTIRALATDSEGRTLIGTSSAPGETAPAIIDRFLDNGMPDTSFTRVVKMGPPADEIFYSDFAFQDDGRILAVGSAGGAGFLQRIWD